MRAQDAEKKAEAESQKEFEKQLEEEKKLDDANLSLSSEERTRRSLDRQRRTDERRKETERKGEERSKIAEQKRDELEKRYDLPTLKRNLLETQASAMGTRWYIFISWLGKVLLVLGLLVLVAQSTGTRQKVLLVVLILVMFSALTGINLDFRAEGRMGESGLKATTFTSPPPPPPSTPTATPSPSPPSDRIFIWPPRP